MKSSKSFLFALLGSIFFISAQDNRKVDSLVALYNERSDDTIKVYLGNLLCKELIYTRPQKAFKYANEMIVTSNFLGYQKGLAMGNYTLGLYFRDRHQIDSAEYYHKSSLQSYQEINNVRGILSNNTQLGDIHILRADFDKAMSYLNENIDLYNSRAQIPNVKESDFKYIGSVYHTISTVYHRKGLHQLSLKNELTALKLYKKYAGELYVADALNGLGTIEGDLGNSDQAIIYYRQALEIYQRSGDVNFACLTLENLGNQLKAIGKYKESLDCYHKALKISEENNYSLAKATLHRAIGGNFLILKETEKAWKHLNKSLQLFKKIEPKTGMEYTYLGLGDFYYTTHELDSSILYLNKGIAIADTIESLKNALPLYKKRSEVFQKIQRYNDALKDYTLYSKLKDSIFNEKKSKQIEELRIIYDTEKKEQEIALLKEKEKASAQQKWFLIASLALVFLLFGIGAYAMLQKAKRNKLEKEKLDAELAFKKKELTTHALHLAKKNEVLESLKQKAEEIKSTENKDSITELVNAINFDLQDDNNWNNFSKYFEQVHKDFNSTVKARFPDVTSNELRLMALLKMNLSSKEIANILNVSQDGVRKAYYRLRKKLSLTADESLRDVVLSL